MMVLASTLVPGLNALLAQGGGATGGKPGDASSLFLPGILLALGVFYVIMLGGNRREKKKRQQMLDQVGKNDRVLTIGGIMGTVVSVKEDEITVKVDETNNTKITFIRSAIQKVITEEDGKPAEKK
jgi:preprotein translocase subunit YajC